MDNNNTFFECFSNWTNKLGKSYSSKYLEACAKCEECKHKGFSKDETEELLAAKGFGTSGLDEILDQYFEPTKKAKANKIDLFIVPTKYADVAGLIEYRLAQKGPQKIISYLTESPMPIMTITPRHKKALLKMAENSIENPSTISYFHAEIKPYIEEAMLNSVLESQRYTPSVKKTADNKFIVELRNKEAMVDLEKGISSGDRYIQGAYGNFGLADEFLVAAHDVVSPFTRIRKVIIQK